MILAGEVFAGSRRIDKPGELLPADTELRVKERRRFVSRGGLKLEHALDHFDIAVAGRVALDAGCSTGGFTHCLLGRGAARVYAVDVGYGQLAWELRNDSRVVVMERTNIRELGAASLDPRPSLLTADLAFMSLRGVLSHLSALVAGDWTMVLLVKPQFEVAREELVSGVVVDDEVRARAVAAVRAQALSLGLRDSGVVESPITGPDGNHEYLLCLRPG